MSARKSLALVALAFAIAALRPCPLLAATSAGKISDAEGAAEVTRAGAKESQVVSENMEIFAGDTLETGDDGKLRVALSDGSTLTLAEGTHFVIKESQFNSAQGIRHSLFELAFGKVRAEVAKIANAAKSRFEIRTPTAVAGVRGTTYEIEHDDSTSESSLYMYEGSADWKDEKTGESLLVPAGQFSQLRPGQKLRFALFTAALREKRAGFFRLSERAKRRVLRRIERRAGRQERRLKRREDRIEKQIEKREENGLPVPERLEKRKETLEKREDRIDQRKERRRRLLRGQ